MKVETANFLTQLFINEIKKEVEKDRDGIHVTDILYPRRKVLDEIYGREVSSKDVYKWLRGKWIHIYLQNILSRYFGGEAEHVVVYEGVTGHIDYFLSGRNEVVEIKTSYAKNEYVKEIAIWQLKLYMAMKNVKRGIVVIIHMRGDNIIGMDEYKVELEEGEIEETRDFIRERAKWIREAIERKDPALAPKCVFEWKCKSCRWMHMCELLNEREEFMSLSSFIGGE